MPKIKSHSGAKKRVKKTGSGRYAMKRNSRQHLLMQKSKKAKRQNRTLLVHATDKHKMKPLVPYL